MTASIDAQSLLIRSGNVLGRGDTQFNTFQDALYNIKQKCDSNAAYFIARTDLLNSIHTYNCFADTYDECAHFEKY